MIFALILYAITNTENLFVDNIYNTHHLFFLNIALQIVGSRELAEDVIQESFIKIMNNANRIMKIEESKQVAFCVVIVKNTAKNVTRQRNYEINHIQKIDYLSSNDFEMQTLNHVEILNSFTELSYEEQDLANLRWAYRLSHSEIATILGISEDTAKKRTQRLRKKLRKIMTERGLDVE